MLLNERLESNGSDDIHGPQTLISGSIALNALTSQCPNFSLDEDDNDIADLISTFGLSPEVGRKQQQNRSNLGANRMSKKADSGGGNTSDESISGGGATLKDKLPKGPITYDID